LGLLRWLASIKEEQAVQKSEGFLAAHGATKKEALALLVKSPLKEMTNLYGNWAEPTGSTAATPWKD